MPLRPFTCSLFNISTVDIHPFDFSTLNVLSKYPESLWKTQMLSRLFSCADKRYFVLCKYCANNCTTNVHRNCRNHLIREVQHTNLITFSWKALIPSGWIRCWKHQKLLFAGNAILSFFYSSETSADARNRAKLVFFVDFSRSFVIQSISSLHPSELL